MAEEKTSKVNKLIGDISQLSVLELSELVKELQEKFGVSAMPVASPSASPGQTEGSGEPQEEKSASAIATVILTGSGANKIGVIKALREINPALGLKEAKDITEATPKEILSNVKSDQANAAKEKLEAAGASVELK